MTPGRERAAASANPVGGIIVVYGKISIGNAGSGGSLGAGADVEGDELVDVFQEAVHVVVFVGVDGDEHALIVVGGDDQQSVADDGVTALLRLAADDQQLSANLGGE